METACCSTHEHKHEEETIQLFIPAIISALVLGIGLALDYIWKPNFFQGYLRMALYLLAYIPVGYPVLKNAVKSIGRGDLFSEFFLMGIATLGAIAIGEYPEAVAVMLFYSVGEAFQDMAVKKAKGNIKSLLDQRPDQVQIISNGQVQIKKAKEVVPGEIIRLKPGEKVALDGILISDSASFNTSALTGESIPDTKSKGEPVLAGMINLQQTAEMEITSLYADSKLSKILELVQNASSKKAPTELFIRKFAKIYTPVVVALAILICLLPFFWVENYEFKEWLYRSLIFLVISCPCALVISIPLGYFGGIGAASKNGILVKGGNYLDLMAKVTHVVTDKTGTLTEGNFRVQSVHLKDPNFLPLINALESHSTHPVASAIQNHVGKVDISIALENVVEVPGHGLKGIYEGKSIIAGNFKLLDKEGISYEVDPGGIPGTLIAAAYDGQYLGYIQIADTVKKGSAKAVNLLQREGIKVTMLSGDKENVVQEVAKELNINEAYGGLLPEDKVNHVQEIKSKANVVAFVGDGINDAPVVALSDIGIAMGGLGSDATIETADVVIQDDNPIKLPLAIKISKMTKSIVWQNIGLAFGVKAIVLLLGAGGVATMWEAVFADVGVAFLAILNAIRIQKKKNFL
jgi:Cd2+/Zn2+-exporting ATPase